MNSSVVAAIRLFACVAGFGAAEAGLRLREQRPDVSCEVPHVR